MKYIGEAKYQYHNSILIMKYSGEITQASCGTLLSLPHPGQQAHRMSSYCRDREQPAVLSHDQAQQVFRLLAPSSSGKVGYSRLCTNLNEVMQVFAALSPLADHVALQFSKGLEPCHQPANLSGLSTIVQTVQPLKRATILSRQFSCSTVNFCLNQCGGIL